MKQDIEITCSVFILFECAGFCQRCCTGLYIKIQYTYILEMKNIFKMNCMIGT